MACVMEHIFDELPSMSSISPKAGGDKRKQVFRKDKSGTVGGNGISAARKLRNMAGSATSSSAYTTADSETSPKTDKEEPSAAQRNTGEFNMGVPIGEDDLLGLPTEGRPTGEAYPDRLTDEGR